MRNFLLTPVLLLAFQVEVLAAQLPSYPVAAVCDEKGAKFGAVAKKFCISEEQYAHDRLKYGSSMPDGRPFQRDTVPDEVKTRCDDETRLTVLKSVNPGGVSPYVHLEGCIIHDYRVYLQK